VIAVVAALIIAVAVYISKQREVVISDDHDDSGSSAFAPHPSA